jgi:hypothetical protein
MNRFKASPARLAEEGSWSEIEVSDQLDPCWGFFTGYLLAGLIFTNIYRVLPQFATGSVYGLSKVGNPVQ